MKQISHEIFTRANPLAKLKIAVTATILTFFLLVSAHAQHTKKQLLKAFPEIKEWVLNEYLISITGRIEEGQLYFSYFKNDAKGVLSIEHTYTLWKVYPDLNQGQPLLRIGISPAVTAKNESRAQKIGSNSWVILQPLPVYPGGDVYGQDHIFLTRLARKVRVKVGSTEKLLSPKGTMIEPSLTGSYGVAYFSTDFGDRESVQTGLLNDNGRFVSFMLPIVRIQ